MKNQLFFILLLIVSANKSHATDQIRYTYYSPPDARLSNSEVSYIDNSMIISLKEKEYYFGDSSREANDCGGQDWVCLSIPSLLHFAYKKEWLTPPKKWTYNGVLYDSLGEVSINILGRPVKGMYICSYAKQSNELEQSSDACFIYTKKSGVLTITLYENGFSERMTNFYISASKNGVMSTSTKDRKEQ